MIKQLKLTPKQYTAFKYLLDKKTTEIFYGGGSGGGKSFLGCVWVLYQCIKYPGVRYLMGRARTKDLRESTMLTLFALMKQFDISDKAKYNANIGSISFWNGSEIYTKDLFLYPRDPEFESLGSREFTGAFIDEASEIVARAKNIVNSRLRYKQNEYDLVPKLLIASNPTKNFLYSEFYKKWKDGMLPEWKAFVPSLVGDNPHLPETYIENLKRLDEKSRQRLLYGNWDYDDDPSKLFERDEIEDIFHLKPKDDNRYLTADIARMGDDRTVICYWQGLYISKMWSINRSSLDVVWNKLQKIMDEYNIPRRNVVVDESGLGGGVVDELKVRGFLGGSRAIDTGKKEAYANLKAQCFFILSDYVKKGKIGIYEDCPFKEYIIDDLDQTRAKNITDSKKNDIVNKSDIKEHLGRSPDFADAISMRMYLELSKKAKPIIYGANIFK